MPAAAQSGTQNISAGDAVERALAATGGGTLESLQFVPEGPAGPAFAIVISDTSLRHEVLIAASDGGLLSLRAYPVPSAAPTTAAAETPAARDGRIRRNPFRPTVSRADAVLIGYTFLASRGFTDATFRRHSGIDFDWGVWSWELYFNYFGAEIELYIDMHTGDIRNFEMEGGARR